MSHLEHLDKDVISFMTLNLDLPNILKLCETSKTLNKKICHYKNFWLNRLLKDYPGENKDFSFIEDPRERYILIWNLSDIKKKLNLIYSLKELYDKKTLYLPNITKLPESFGNLINLKSLMIENNKLLSELPESFGNLKNLIILYLTGNGLTKLPESFGNLINLQDLQLSFNKLSELPESFGNLTGLQTLYLRNNNLTQLPESFGNLRNLTTLWLNGNKISEIPESLMNLSNSGKLDLRW